MSAFLWLWSLFLWCIFALQIAAYRRQTTPWHMTSRYYVSGGSIFIAGVMAGFAAALAIGVIK